MIIEQIAKICHEANKAYCETIGDTSQKSWEEAEEWQRDSARNGVKYRLKHLGAHASEQHNNWRKEKEIAGWKYGKVKDPIKKEHPCMVDYDKLPAEQKVKDELFKFIVLSLVKYMNKFE